MVKRLCEMPLVLNNEAVFIGSNVHIPLIQHQITMKLVSPDHDEQLTRFPSGNVCHRFTVEYG